MKTTGTILFAALGACLLAQEPGVVFTMDNSSTGNNVLIYRRAADGRLTPAGAVSTQGLGTGAGLGSQGALNITQDGRWLLAVNAGSNDVSFFRLNGASIQFISKTPSGGTMPISVTSSGDVAFVLNAGGVPDIQAFRIRNRGLFAFGGGAALTGSAPAEVSFNQDETLLAVTDKGSNTIETFLFNFITGALIGPLVQNSSGQEPFGFAFDRRGRMIVSEAFSGAPGQAAVSSYQVDDSTGTLTTVTPSLGNGQTAACWIALSKDERFAFVANTGSNTISSAGISRVDGSLSYVNVAAATTGAGPADLAVSADGRFLYSRNGGDGSISEFRINSSGTLTPIGGIIGVPPGLAGLVAR